MSNTFSKEAYAESVELAELFLRGKNEEVLLHLQQQMTQASTQMNYELAAELRDQIARLRQMQDKQYVSSAFGNADVIGLAVHAGVVCLQILTIREGQILASQTYYPSVPADSGREEILSAFISQHYLGQTATAEMIPRLIIVEAALVESEMLENTLSQQAQHKVEIYLPQRGDKKKWLELAEGSARESLAAHLLGKANMNERFAALQEALALPKPLTRIECFDISHSMARQRLLLVWFLTGKAR